MVMYGLIVLVAELLARELRHPGLLVVAGVAVDAGDEERHGDFVDDDLERGYVIVQRGREKLEVYCIYYIYALYAVALVGGRGQHRHEASPSSSRPPGYVIHSHQNCRWSELEALQPYILSLQPKCLKPSYMIFRRAGSIRNLGKA